MEGIMKWKRSKVWRKGVGAGVVIFVIFVLIGLVVVRSLWFGTADRHYDNVISAYIAETEDYEDEDKGELRKRLLEGGIFIKIFRWDKKSFVKDTELYNEMLKAYDEQQGKKKGEVSELVEDLINL
jgi:hypothetical protein